MELYCEDDQGCRELKYGIATSTALCQPTQNYNQKISIDQNSWLCYYAADNTGKTYSASKQIVYSDDDGDGVLNSCDVCEDTDAGKNVNEQGCAPGQVPISQAGTDSDQDGLPDYWEQQYNGLNCVFDYLAPDSNANSIDDPLEDYDVDGSTNVDEFTADTDPCFARDVSRVRNETRIPALPGVSDGASNVLAWVLLLVGLGLVGGGIGYLAYYTRSSGSSGVASKGVISGFGAGSLAKRKGISNTTPTTSTFKNIGQNISQSLGTIFGKRRGQQGREQLRERQEVFGKFGRTSENIPHVDEVLRMKSAHLPKLQELAQRYVDHKDEIKPGLRSEEKSIFTRLENIAKKTKDTDIEEVVSTKEAKDIFSKLKEISDKRKGKGK